MSKGKFNLAEPVRDMFFELMQKLVTGGAIEIWSGPMPWSPSATPLDGEILVRAPVVWNEQRQTAKTENAPVLRAGTAEWARAVDAGGFALWDADCGSGGCTIYLENADLRLGQIVMLETIAFYGL
jgi:hypothetical protein